MNNVYYICLFTRSRPPLVSIHHSLVCSSMSVAPSVAGSLLLPSCPSFNPVDFSLVPSNIVPLSRTGRPLDPSLMCIARSIAPVHHQSLPVTHSFVHSCMQLARLLVLSYLCPLFNPSCRSSARSIAHVHRSSTHSCPPSR